MHKIAQGTEISSGYATCHPGGFMNLFGMLRDQMGSVRLPLFAVTVTAAAQVNTTLIAMLHWHGFPRATPLVLPGVEIPRRPAPASTIELEAPWHSFETVDAMLLDAAWQSGAWECPAHRVAWLQRE